MTEDSWRRKIPEAVENDLGCEDISSYVEMLNEILNTELNLTKVDGKSQDDICPS
ncbi:hypothetical protein [Scytonema sp. NUACC26]|uniref:hypothetical protein n=1 Tax=Scytonema sp. NUACC26 TaxID=3140176 RepID=UPI0038B3896B